jgi:hypothetical protein
VSDQIPEPPSPRTYFEPTSPEGEVARKNIRLGFALFVIALVVAAGAVVISLIYLQFD